MRCTIIIIIQIRYRARPGCVLLVLHTAKRVVTTGALPSAGSGGPSSFPPPRTAHPHPRRTQTRALAATRVPSAAGWCARVQSCRTRVRHCISVSTRTYQSFYTCQPAHDVTGHYHNIYLVAWRNVNTT